MAASGTRSERDAQRVDGAPLCGDARGSAAVETRVEVGIFEKISQQ